MRVFENEQTSDLDAAVLLAEMRPQNLTLDQATWKLDMGDGRKEGILGNSWVSGLSKWMDSSAIC